MIKAVIFDMFETLGDTFSDERELYADRQEEVLNYLSSFTM